MRTIIVLALAIPAMVVLNQSASASPNPNAQTRGNSGKVKNQASAANRKTACTKVRASVANRVANLQQSAEQNLKTIDKVYASLLNIGSTRRVEPAQSVKAQVESSRSDVIDAIQSVGQNEDNINCEDKNVGQMAAIVRLDVQRVNESLKAYRSAVNDALASTRSQIEQAGNR